MRIALSFVSIFFLQAAAAAQSPWATKEDQEWIRKHMPKGVPLSERAKVFRLPQVYQSLIVLNNRPTNTVEAVSGQVDPWRVSGGMHLADPKDWRNVTLLDLPDGGKIKMWLEQTDAGALYPVPKWRWAFPKGTLAYDVLLRTKNPLHRVFEVRISERGDKTWETGRVFRPDVEPPDVEPVTKKWMIVSDLVEGRVTIEGKGAYRATDSIPADVSFAERLSVLSDRGGLVPENYFGAGASCSSCHRHAGKRTGYGQAIRGDDGRFSWHPFNENGQIDTRWPVEIVKQ
jgi:hypothetical protein